MQIAFPLGSDHRGRTGEVDQDRHIRDLIEQLLFTMPGERVNRPTFGCGLNRLVFEPLASELAMTAQFMAQAALAQGMADLIEVQDVQAEQDDAVLRVTVSYRVRRTQEARTEVFVAPGVAT